MTQEHYCPETGKRSYESYAEALTELDALEQGREAAHKRGSVYTCLACEMFHISKRQFTVWRRKGRGKSRRNLVGMAQ
jgi:hypothetical protein